VPGYCHASADGRGRNSSLFLTSALEESEWSASRPAALYPLERTSVPITYEARWASELVWTQRLEKKFFASAGGWTAVRSQTLYWLSYHRLFWKFKIKNMTNAVKLPIWGNVFLFSFLHSPTLMWVSHNSLSNWIQRAYCMWPMQCDCSVKQTHSFNLMSRLKYVELYFTPSMSIICFWDTGPSLSL
jgi:hypothetical protein